MKRLALTALIALAVAVGCAHADNLARVFKVSGRFADVKENVVTAIEGQGLVINSTSYISDMLHRTGGDIGNATPIYGQAEMLEFCSAGASRAMMAADPRNMVFCPYAISVYTLPGQPDEVFVAYRLLPDTRAFKPARELIESIVHDALN